MIMLEFQVEYFCTHDKFNSNLKLLGRKELIFKKRVEEKTTICSYIEANRIEGIKINQKYSHIKKK